MSYARRFAALADSMSVAETAKVAGRKSRAITEHRVRYPPRLCSPPSSINALPAGRMGNRRKKPARSRNLSRLCFTT